MVKNTSEIFIEKLKKIQWGKLFHMFYIEPVVLALIFSHALSGTIMKNQVIFQACTTVFLYNESDCLQLDSTNSSEYAKKIETEVQPYIANLFMIRTLLESIVPALCGLFIGSWSDYYGRKPLLLISMIGFSLTYILSAIICELSFYYPVNPWYYIIAAVPHSILGGNCVFSVAALCFITDVTDTKTRPYRMLFMEALFFVALTSGSLLSSFIYSATNSTTVFSISGILVCGATVFIALCVPETLHMHREEECNKNNKSDRKEEELSKDITITECALSALPEKVDLDSNESEKDKTNDEKSKTDNLKGSEKIGLFSHLHIKDMFSNWVKKRDCYDRCIIWLITGTMFITIFVMDGAMGIVYLFVREKFHWTVRDFTFYETVSHSVPIVGALVGFLILRKVFGLSIVALTIISFFSEILGSITRGIAFETWHMYLAVGLGIFRSISGAMCRTMVSNIVPPTDIGKIFSIKHVLQSFAPFLASPLYTFIYQKSLTTFPGLFFIVSACLYGIAFIFMLIVLYIKLNNKEYYKKSLK